MISGAVCWGLRYQIWVFKALGLEGLWLLPENPWARMVGSKQLTVEDPGVGGRGLMSHFGVLDTKS